MTFQENLQRGWHPEAATTDFSRSLCILRQLNLLNWRNSCLLIGERMSQWLSPFQGFRLIGDPDSRAYTLTKTGGTSPPVREQSHPSTSLWYKICTYKNLDQFPALLDALQS
jgi:hypothetical protein